MKIIRINISVFLVLLCGCQNKLQEEMNVSEAHLTSPLFSAALAIGIYSGENEKLPDSISDVETFCSEQGLSCSEIQWDRLSMQRLDQETIELTDKETGYSLNISFSESRPGNMQKILEQVAPFCLDVVTGK